MSKSPELFNEEYTIVLADGPIERIIGKYSVNTNHGAPCSIRLMPRDQNASAEYWQLVHNLDEQLNKGADYDYCDKEKTNPIGHDFAGKHILAGGSGVDGQSAYMDTIAPDALAPMLKKTIHLLGEAKVITQNAVKQALAQAETIEREIPSEEILKQRRTEENVRDRVVSQNAGHVKRARQRRDGGGGMSRGGDEG